MSINPLSDPGVANIPLSRIKSENDGGEEDEIDFQVKREETDNKTFTVEKMLNEESKENIISKSPTPAPGSNGHVIYQSTISSAQEETIVTLENPKKSSCWESFKNFCCCCFSKKPPAKQDE